MRSKNEGAGWVIVDETPARGRKGARYFLVAATGPAQALALAQQEVGKNRALSVRGPADATHLSRRNMKLGDVLEIMSRQNISRNEASERSRQ